jgi:hypothetical protein
MFFRKQKEEEIENLEEKKLRSRKKSDEDELVWDKKRVIIAIGLVILAIIFVKEIKDNFFPNYSILGESTVKKVAEVKKPEIESPDLNLQSKVSNSLDDIKDNISSIDPEEVATSSPQIQKVLRDIQGIKNLPVDKAKEACYKVCSNL